MCLGVRLGGRSWGVFYFLPALWMGTTQAVFQGVWEVPKFEGCVASGCDVLYGFRREHFWGVGIESGPLFLRVLISLSTCSDVMIISSSESIVRMKCRYTCMWLGS